MEFKEKAKIRIEHWIKHADVHVSEYAQFAEELESSGYADAARNIREMAEITAKCSQHLENALLSVDDAS